MKPKPDRQLIRLAMTIAEQLGRRKETDGLLLPEATWADCRRINHQLHRARERGWHQAVRRLRNELSLALNQMRDELAVAAETAEASGRPQWSASAQDIYRDLLALRSEFVDLSIELRNRLLSVSTDPIVLEGLELGPFKIELDWSEMPLSEEYRVIALDPQPAAGNDSVTHPHVQDESLCAGEARHPIRRALAEGRLLDFFLIVRQTLETYNDASPFVKLEDWHGAYCSDCGGSAAEDDRTCCGKCETTVCYDCTRSCEACSSYFCSECVEHCAKCDHDVCTECSKSCRECDESFCPNCLTNQTCEACHEQQKNEESQSPADATAVTV